MIEIKVTDEVAEVIIQEFCREHIGFCDRHINELGDHMKTRNLRDYEKRDLADTIQHRLHLVAVYNYCSSDKWKEEEYLSPHKFHELPGSEPPQCEICYEKMMHPLHFRPEDEE